MFKQESQLLLGTINAELVDRLDQSVCFSLSLFITSSLFFSLSLLFFSFSLFLFLISNPTNTLFFSSFLFFFSFLLFFSSFLFSQTPIGSMQFHSINQALSEHGFFSLLSSLFSLFLSFLSSLFSFSFSLFFLLFLSQEEKHTNKDKNSFCSSPFSLSLSLSPFFSLIISCPFSTLLFLLSFSFSFLSLFFLFSFSFLSLSLLF